MSKSFFDIRGVVEGFYGFFYTHHERLTLLKFLGRHGYNTYFYAPKNDRYHRDRWREPYLVRLTQSFQETIQTAKENGIDFCYCLSPGISMCYSSTQDFAVLTEKYRYFYQLGVRRFSLLLDDISPDFFHEEDRTRYRTVAEAHADLCNRVYAWLKFMDEKCELSMCPTDYAGAAPFSPYLYQLGQALNPDILIMYTGVQVCSKTISREDAQAFGEVVQRKPLIWDNYPVNDGGMASDLHIGPIRGRDQDLYQSVAGILVNPMNQAEASKIALATYGDYFKNPACYNPDSSWHNRIEELVGEVYRDAFMVIAETSQKSCLKMPEAEKLERLVSEVLQVINNGGSSECAAITALDNYLTLIDESSYLITTELPNDSLRHEILPWLELCDHWRRLGKASIQVYRCLTSQTDFQKQLDHMKTAIEAIKKHPKRIMGYFLMPLAEVIIEKAETR